MECTRSFKFSILLVSYSLGMGLKAVEQQGDFTLLEVEELAELAELALVEVGVCGGETINAV